MAGEVVGTAFVRIKALTKGLGKEIEKSVKKGMADAKLDKVGEEEGEKLGTALGDSAVDSASDRIKERSGDIVPKGVFDDVRKQFENENPFSDFDLIPEGAEDKVRKSFDRQAEIVRSGMDRINNNIEREWPTKNRNLAPDFDKLWAKADRDTNKFANSLGRLQARMKSFADTPGLGGGITKLLGGVAGLAVVALPYIQDLGAGILAYGTGIVAQLGFMTTAVVGLAAAAGAAVGSSLLPIIPIMLAFKAETDVLIEFKDSMKAAAEEFSRIGVATQATLLPALDRAVFQMGELVPMFSEFGLYVGQSIGAFTEWTAATLTGEKAQGRWGDILRSSLRILDMLLPTLLNVGDMLSGLWVAAIPASERFVGTLSDIVQRWTDIVNWGLNSGQLTDTLNTWYGRAELLGSALGNLSGALFDILSVGANSADNVFVRFDAWAERFRTWTESEVGQNRLALIFDNSLAVMREVNGVAVELFDGIFGRLDEVGGVDSMVESLQRFQEIIPGVKEQFQGFIDQVRDVNSLLGPILREKILQAFEELKEPLGRLIFAILDVMRAMEESGAFETFLDLLHILADVLTTLLSIPGFGTFVGYMLAFGGAAKVASFALGPLVAVLGPFVGIIKTLATARAGTALATTATGLVGLIASTRGAVGAANATKGLGGALTALKAGAGGSGGLLKTVGAGLLPLGPVGIAAGIGIAAAGTAFFLASKESKAFDQEVRQITSALGELNGGLNITAEGLQKYIEEESRFNSRNQKDDLANMGFSVEALSEQIADGTMSFSDFADAALNAGEVQVTASRMVDRSAGPIGELATSMEGLQKQFNLTSEEMEELARGGEVFTNDGVQVMLSGNDDLLESFEELNNAMGKAAKEGINDFALNAQNARLLGAEALASISNDIREADDDEAAGKMLAAMNRLGEAAVADSAKVTGLTDAMRDQIRAQVEHLTGNEKALAYNALLRAEQDKLFTQIRANYDLYNSVDFGRNFKDARREVAEFSYVVQNLDWDNFRFTAAFGDLDSMADGFPAVGNAASELFEVLRGLPEEEFNAAAQVMNADAASLRDAMNGAQQAIIDLQETALSRLPSIQEALDQNLKTREDGSQYFDTEGFATEATNRINKTNKFAEDLEYIHREQGLEAARIALEQGPESARALAEGLAVSDGRVEELLGKMEAAKNNVTTKVKDLFGETLAAEYLATVKPVGDNMALGLTAGLNSQQTIEAIGQGGTAVLNTLVKGFKGRFEWDGTELKFVKTGSFGGNAPTQFRTPGGGLVTLAGGGGETAYFSKGGFVGMTAFNSGPKGKDTIPAWLAPGEFVLRQTVAQAIPPGVLNALNAGDPHMINLLTSLGKNRPGNPAAQGALANIPPPQTSRGGTGNVIIQQMNIEAPTPYETSRQVANRLRILQTQMANG